MEKKTRKVYQPPMAKVFEHKSEKILCGSPQYNLPYEEDIDW
jgi:hypothetical protein